MAGCCARMEPARYIFSKLKHCLKGRSHEVMGTIPHYFPREQATSVLSGCVSNWLDKQLS